MTRLDVGSEAIVIGSKWSYLYITSTCMTNTGTNIATDSKTIGRKILISIWREKLNEFYFPFKVGSLPDTTLIGSCSNIFFLKYGADV